MKSRSFLGRQIIRRDEMEKAIGEPCYCAELSFAQLGRARDNGIEGRLSIRR
jgi:hypothetical protein